MSPEAGPSWRAQLAPRTSADTDGEVQRLLGKLEQAGRGELIVQLVANAPSALRPWVLFSDALLFRGVLPAADRELIVLLLAARDRLDYVASVHRSVALAAGLTAAQVDALASSDPDRLAAVFGSRERAAARLAGALADDEFGEPEWDEAVTLWGADGALEFALVVGWWGGMVKVVSRALALEPLGAD